MSNKINISVEDIYIKIESIFDNNQSGYDRRLETYKMLNDMLPKWEGIGHNKYGGLVCKLNDSRCYFVGNNKECNLPKPKCKYN